MHSVCTNRFYSNITMTIPSFWIFFFFILVHVIQRRAGSAQHFWPRKVTTSLWWRYVSTMEIVLARKSAVLQWDTRFVWKP